MDYDRSSLLHLPPELQYLIISHLAAPIKPLIPDWDKLTGIERSNTSLSSPDHGIGGGSSGGGGGGSGGNGGAGERAAVAPPTISVNVNGYGYGPTISIVRTGLDNVSVAHHDVHPHASGNGGAVSAKYYDDAKRNLLFRHHRVLPLMLVNRYFYATVTRYLRNPAVVFSGDQLRAAERRWKDEGAREDMKHLVIVTYHEDWRGLLDNSVVEELQQQRERREASSGSSPSDSERDDDKGQLILGGNLNKLSLLSDMTFASVFFKRAYNSIRNLTYLNLHVNSGPLHKVALKEALANIPGQFSKTLTHCYLHGNRIAITSKMFQHEWPNLKELFVDSPVIGLMQRDIASTFKKALVKFADMVAERDNKKIAAATAEEDETSGGGAGGGSSTSSSGGSSSSAIAKGKAVNRGNNSGGGGGGSSTLYNSSSVDKSLERTRIFIRIRKHHSTHAGPFFLLTNYPSNRSITSGVVCWYPRPAELNPIDEDGNEDYYHAKVEEWNQIEMDVSEYHYAMEHGFFDDDSEA